MFERKEMRAHTCTNTQAYTRAAKTERGAGSKLVASVQNSIGLTRSHLFSCSGLVLFGCTQSCPTPDLTGPRSKVGEQGTRSQCRKIHLPTWYAHLAWAVSAPVFPPPGVGPLPPGRWGTLESQRPQPSPCFRGQTLCREGHQDQKSETCCFQWWVNDSIPGSVTDLKKHHPPLKFLFAKSGN